MPVHDTNGMDRVQPASRLNSKHIQQ